MLRGSNLLGIGGFPRVGNDAFTKSLLHFDGANGGTTFTDSNFPGTARTWTPTGTVTSTADRKFGSASGLFATGNLSLPHHIDFNLGVADWTIDAWLNRNGATGVTHYLFAKESAALPANAQYSCNFTTANQVRWTRSDGAAFSSGTFGSAFPSSGWHHFALVNSGGLIGLYIDGVKDATNVSAAGIVSASWDFQLGFAAGRTPPEHFTGYMDEFRLSNVARWTSNFSPPSFAYGP